ncbi:hypothetical protein AcW1_005223 [Taiwanofungus camphoratus]|nr:hypothetical protein AcW2_003993 [Antrodia cinnamomea]KAI0956579.1 hypothetical protein AcW1_005223 [Antrodia cinnamomea]
MSMVLLSVLAVSLFTLAQGRTLPLSLQVHEARDSTPNGYTLAGPASPDTVLNLRIALVESNPDGLIDALYDVSIPSSAKYGQHLSKAEVEEFVSPTSDSVAAVNNWLKENNLTAITLSPAGDWLGIDVPVSKANEMLAANYSTFIHDSSGQRLVRTLSYSIPSDLKGHIDLVHPTVTFASPLIIAPRSSSLPLGSSIPECANATSPACLQSLYGIPTTLATQSGNNLTVTGYIDEYANMANLKTFLTVYRPDMSASTTFTVEEIDDGEDNQNPAQAGTEANLDTQYTVGLATGVPVTFLSVGNNYTDGIFGFLDTVNYFLSQNSVPQVVSTSYGSDEGDVSTALFYKLCNSYAQLGARGVSILFCSGDGGVGGFQDYSSSTVFVPTFPSGCPYITSVGATKGTNPEVAASFSSGGFSNVWSTPSYQQDAVNAYLSTLGNTYSGLYNASGRGFPDVSAQGVNFPIVVDQNTELVDGTSCSTPTFASVIALLNDQLIAAGKPVLGFLNPFLYSQGSTALNDVTIGDNPGSNTSGFNATPGWDPVTGLGTPNFPKLQAALGL